MMSAMTDYYRNLSIRNKLITIFSVIFITGFILNFIVASNKLRSESISYIIREAEELTGALEKVRHGMGDIFTSDMYDMEKLLANPDKLFLAVPVVQSLVVGAQMAAGADYSFRAPAFDARNPENTPTPLEARLLTRLKNENMTQIYEIDEATNSLYYLRKVVLDETCMGCHGLISESLTGTLTDPLGYAMEGWRPGDMHGAFELIMPLDNVDAAVKAAAISSGITILIIISVGVGVLFLMVNIYLTRPIQGMVVGLKALAQNDLTAEVEVTSKDEIGQMATAFNTSVRQLSDVMIKIRGSSGEVDKAATAISSTSEELAAGAEEQQAQLSEVATTMEQMSAMITQASKNANETRENAQYTGKTADQGRATISKTVTGFETVVKTVERAADQIEELSRRSVEIGNVIQVIDDIADQTNLLALNANIEAARAGDAGRGFAVVADEVRKLAERTVSATSEISKMIETIQGDIRGAVTSMEEIQGQSKEGLDLVAESDSSLEEIANSINSVVNAVEQIATAANEQSSGAEEISKNIEGVTTVAKESASSAQQMATSAEQMNREVQDLNDLISQFKVSDGHGQASRSSSSSRPSDDPLTRQQIRLVQRSFAKVEPIADRTAELFYGRLFELDPSLKPLFKGDMTEQGRKLMQMLGVAVKGLNNLDSIVPAVQDLGRRHVDYGVKESHYRTVGEALLWALEQGLGDDFTADTRTAWAATYNLLAEVMTTAARGVKALA